jgi:IclR family acetate operon transcriptional repressor
MHGRVIAIPTRYPQAVITQTRLPSKARSGPSSHVAATISPQLALITQTYQETRPHKLNPVTALEARFAGSPARARATATFLTPLRTCAYASAGELERANAPSARPRSASASLLNRSRLDVTVAIVSIGSLKSEIARPAEHSQARQLERAFDVLELLAEHGEAKAGEIINALGVPRASVHRLLTVLQSRGYIERSSSLRTYRLGPGIRWLALRSRPSTLHRLTERALADLRAKTGETVNLGVVRDGRIVYEATLDGAHVPRMSAVVGSELEAHATALGKAIVATVTEPARQALLRPAPYPALTPQTITEPEALDRELTLVAKRGFAVDDQETNIGAVCVAAPIVDEHGAAIAALSISGTTERLPPQRRSEFATLVQDWCRRISAELNVTGGSQP